MPAAQKPNRLHEIWMLPDISFFSWLGADASPQLSSVYVCATLCMYPKYVWLKMQVFVDFPYSESLTLVKLLSEIIQLTSRALVRSVHGVWARIRAKHVRNAAVFPPFVQITHWYKHACIYSLSLYCMHACMPVCMFLCMPMYM